MSTIHSYPGWPTQGRATYTVVFTDLAASTPLRTRVGEDQFDTVREEYDRALAAAVEAHGGAVVKRTGDGCMAEFRAASGGLDAAVAIQQAITRLARALGQRLEVRVGVAIGDARSEEGDVHGMVVVEAARLCAAASPGQILCTDVVRAIAGSRGDHSFRSAKARKLKGLSGPVTTWEVVWSLPDEAVLPLPSLVAATPDALVGRVAESRLLEDAWRRATSGNGGLVLVAGEPGIGKTHFAAQVARHAHAEGGVVLTGSCDEDLGAPFAPWVEALDHLVTHAPPDYLPALLGDSEIELARLVPRLRPRIPELGVASRPDPEDERRQLLDAVAAVLARLTRQAPVLMVLDDLHWADASSLLLLRRVAREAASMRLLVLGTYRDTDVDRSHPLAGTLAELRREWRFERVVLRGLSRQEVASLIASRAGGAPPDFVHAVHTNTEGNPFFVVEILANLGDMGRLQDGWPGAVDLDELVLPEGVREVIGQRLSRLSDTANEALSVAAVIGLEFDLRVLAAIVGLAPPALFDALDEAVRTRVLREIKGVLGRYAFAHALVRRTLLDELTGTTRVRLHWRVGEAIRALQPDDVDAIAHHLGEGVLAGDVGSAVDAALAAAWRAAELLSGEAQAGHCRQALAILDAAPPDPERRCRVLLGLANAATSLDDHDGLRAACLEAAEIARALERADLLGDAAAMYAQWPGFGGLDQAGANLVEEALAALNPHDSVTRAHLLSTLAFQRALAIDPTAAALNDEALAMATRLDDRVGRFGALATQFLIGTGSPDLARLAALAQEMATLSNELPIAWDRVATTSAMMFTGLRAGDRASFEELKDLLLSRVVGVPTPTPHSLVVPSDITLALLDGRFAEAEARATDALGRVQMEALASLFLGQLLAVQLEQGQLDTAEATLAAFVAAAPGVSFPTQSAVGVIAALRGQLDDAARALAAVAANPAAAVAVDITTPFAVWQWSELCARLGDVTASVALEPFVAPWSGQLLVGPYSYQAYAAADRCLGQLAAARGDHDEAEASYRAALALEERVGSPPLIARTRYWYARTLATRAGPADCDAARYLAAASLADSERLGMTILAQETTQLVDALET